MTFPKRTSFLDVSGYMGYRCLCFWLALSIPGPASSNPDAKRLYDDLIMKNYNKHCRPVRNYPDVTIVRIGMSLAQVVDVDEVNQILTVNLWVEQVGTKEGKSADGAYTVSTTGKAVIYPDGKVSWNPPMQFKSSCEIDVEYFPFDQQEFHMKFGAWTHDATKVDMHHIDRTLLPTPEIIAEGQEVRARVEHGMTLDDYQRSVEWDLMEVTATEHLVQYPCCPTKYPDVTFTITLKRRTLYYIINLIIPCLSMNILTCLAFYLPSYSGEKISICISVFLALTIFQLVLLELVPSSSLKLPLVGKYILMTSLLCTLCVFSNIFILSINYRSTSTHEMSHFTRWMFLRTLPKLLHMPNPIEEAKKTSSKDDLFSYESLYSDLSNYGNPYRRKREMLRPLDRSTDNLQTPFGFDEDTLNLDKICEACVRRRMANHAPNVRKAIDGVCFLAKHYGDSEEALRIQDEWRFVAQVIDRVLLWINLIFTIICSLTICLNAPALYDSRQPLTASSPTAKSYVVTNYTTR